MCKTVRVAIDVDKSAFDWMRMHGERMGDGCSIGCVIRSALSLFKAIQDQRDAGYTGLTVGNPGTGKSRELAPSVIGSLFS